MEKKCRILWVFSEISVKKSWNSTESDRSGLCSNEISKPIKKANLCMLLFLIQLRITHTRTHKLKRRRSRRNICLMCVLGGLKPLKKLRFGIIIWARNRILSHKPRIDWTMVEPIWEKRQRCTQISEANNKKAPRSVYHVAFSFSTLHDIYLIHCAYANTLTHTHTQYIKIIICELNKIMITWFGKPFWDGLIIFFIGAHFSFLSSFALSPSLFFFHAFIVTLSSFGRSFQRIFDTLLEHSKSQRALPIALAFQEFGT